jgi:hypothetical protein
MSSIDVANLHIILKKEFRWVPPSGRERILKCSFMKVPSHAFLRLVYSYILSVGVDSSSRISLYSLD